MKNNTYLFTFENQIIPETNLPILYKVKLLLDKYNFKESYLSSTYKSRTDSQRFKDTFDEFNKSYPLIELLHRCLIVIRYFNKNLADKSDNHFQKNMNLYKIYYPLFYSISMFVHISMLYYSLDYANYDAIIKNPVFNDLSNITGQKIYIIINERDFNNKSFRRFSSLKTNLKTILNDVYKDFSVLYNNIKTYVQENIETVKIKESNTSNIKIHKFDSTYFGVPLILSESSNRNNISESTSGPATRRSNTTTSATVNLRSKKNNIKSNLRNTGY